MTKLKRKDKDMLFNNNSIAISFSVNQYQCNNIEIWDDENGKEEKVLVELRSTFDTKFVRCPYCGGAVRGHGEWVTILDDMPIWMGLKQEVYVRYHRYQCKECRKVFSEDICIKHPGTRVTERAATWVKGLLRYGMSVKAISEITGLHWNTVRAIHEEVIADEQNAYEDYIKSTGYKPRLLAVDEFAIHKGHTYATSVLDLETGYVIWVGKGRTKEDFANFFEEVDADYLSEVNAIAMDMNASYNKVVQEKLPLAKIVYDRYHMQAQYGKEVLGEVRLSEARKHQSEAQTLKADAKSAETSEAKATLREEAKKESKKYTRLKRARWLLLKNSRNLTEKAKVSLGQILESHEQLAICYAMKEEMCDLFELRDPEESRKGWEKWFAAAEASGIDQLASFARRKKDRIDGLVAHATYPISTGKLEGLNNKIKVAKRIGFGYRNDEYFFSLIRFLTIPAL